MRWLPLVLAVVTSIGCFGGQIPECEGRDAFVGEREDTPEGEAVFVYGMHDLDETVVFCARLGEDGRVHERAVPPHAAEPAVGLVLERPVATDTFTVRAWLASDPERVAMAIYETEEENHVVVRAGPDAALAIMRVDAPPAQFGFGHSR